MSPSEEQRPIGTMSQTGRESSAPAPGSPPRRALLVVGMHRSGTSAITRLLSLCGADLPKRLMAAGAHNPRGYFESQALYELHQELLAEAGSSWDDLAPFPPGWLQSPAAPAWIERAVKTLRDDFGDSPFITVKDPRLCRLVPFWLKVLEQIGAEPSFVLSVRNPLDTAASLRRAQGTEQAKALLLWLQYFLSAERDTRGFKRSFVSYEALIRDWRSVLASLSSDLDLVFPRLGRKAEAEIDDFLEQDLRHHASTAEELLVRHDVAGWLKRVFDWANRAAAGETMDPGVLDAVQAELAPAEATFGPLLASVELTRDKALDKARRLEAKTQHLERRLERLATELGGAERRVALAEDDLAHAREQISLGQQQMAKLIDWVKAVLQWSSHVIDGSEPTQDNLDVAFREFDSADPTAIPQIATMGIRLAQHSAEAARLAEESDVRGARIERLTEENKELDKQLRQQVAAKQAELEQLERDRQEEVARLDRQRQEQFAAKQAELEEQVTAKQAELQELNRRMRGLWQQISARDTEFSRLRDELALRTHDVMRAGEQADELRAELAARQREIELASGAVTERDLYIRLLRAELAAIGSSKLARILPRADRTRPSDGAASSLQRALQLLFWTLTFQLPRRLRESRAVGELRGSGLFDDDYYTASYPDVAETGGDPLAHYVRHGAREGRNPNPHFDTVFYLEHNADVARAGANPLAHYLRSGADEGRDPGPGFDTLFYLDDNPFVRESKMNPLAHYLHFGRQRGRRPRPDAEVPEPEPAGDDGAPAPSRGEPAAEIALIRPESGEGPAESPVTK